MSAGERQKYAPIKKPDILLTHGVGVVGVTALADVAIVQVHVVRVARIVQNT